jgi:hypothetical protein
MNLQELQEAKTLLSKIIKEFTISDLIGDRSLDNALDENYETLFSGYKALLNIIKIYNDELNRKSNEVEKRKIKNLFNDLGE